MSVSVFVLFFSYYSLNMQWHMKLRINQSLGARHLAFPFLSLSDI